MATVYYSYYNAMHANSVQHKMFAHMVSLLLTQYKINALRSCDLIFTPINGSMPISYTLLIWYIQTIVTYNDPVGNLPSHYYSIHITTRVLYYCITILRIPSIVSSKMPWFPCQIPFNTECSYIWLLSF